MILPLLLLLLLFFYCFAMPFLRHQQIYFLMRLTVFREHYNDFLLPLMNVFALQNKNDLSRFPPLSFHFLHTYKFYFCVLNDLRWIFKIQKIYPRYITKIANFLFVCLLAVFHSIKLNFIYMFFINFLQLSQHQHCLSFLHSLCLCLSLLYFLCLLSFYDTKFGIEESL